jgi:hypothetical protein
MRNIVTAYLDGFKASRTVRARMSRQPSSIAAHCVARSTLVAPVRTSRGASTLGGRSAYRRHACWIGVSGVHAIADAGVHADVYADVRNVGWCTSTRVVGEGGTRPVVF